MPAYTARCIRVYASTRSAVIHWCHNSGGRDGPAVGVERISAGSCASVQRLVRLLDGLPDGRRGGWWWTKSNGSNAGKYRQGDTGDWQEWDVGKTVKGRWPDVVRMLKTCAGCRHYTGGTSAECWRNVGWWYVLVMAVVRRLKSASEALTGRQDIGSRVWADIGRTLAARRFEVVRMSVKCHQSMYRMSIDSQRCI